MNLQDLILGSENNSKISEIAKQFNLNEDQTRGAIGQLLPSLQRGIQRNTSGEKGLDELLAAIEKGNHQRYLDEPNILSKQQSADDGNSILGHIFGNKEVSRNVATHASKNTGLSSGLMKKLLPIIASIAMGTISKKVLGGGRSRQSAPSQSRGIVASLLDSDNDGSVIDDILGMAFKALR
jgi:hypothetical protein